MKIRHAHADCVSVTDKCESLFARPPSDEFAFQYHITSLYITLVNMPEWMGPIPYDARDCVHSGPKIDFSLLTYDTQSIRQLSCWINEAFERLRHIVLSILLTTRCRGSKEQQIALKVPIVNRGSQIELDRDLYNWDNGPE